MDSVRFGRALGFGARAAAKTLVTAVDAATAPNPSRPANSAPTETKAAATGTKLGQQAVQNVTQTVAQARQTGEGLKRGSQQFGKSAWGPFVRLSGVLWLEVTGLFFGIFGLFAGLGTWRLRGEWHRTPLNHDAHLHLLASAAMALVFGYFCVSSFVRAGRKSRQR